MTKTDDNGNGASRGELTIITLGFNHETCQVLLSMEDVPISLAQMIVHEAATQLEIMRRQAAALEFQKQAIDKAKTTALAASIFGKR